MKDTESKSKRASFVRRFTITAAAAGVAVFFLAGLSAQPENSAQLRPFKFKGIELGSTADPGGMSGTWNHVGEATHMGNTVGAGIYKITGIDNGVYSYWLRGTYTAANGDSVLLESSDYTIDWSDVPPVGIGTVQVVEGTGRFADVSGWLKAVVLYYETPEVHLEGTVSY